MYPDYTTVRGGHVVQFMYDSAEGEERVFQFGGDGVEGYVSWESAYFPINRDMALLLIPYLYLNMDIILQSLYNHEVRSPGNLKETHGSPDTMSHRTTAGSNIPPNFSVKQTNLYLLKLLLSVFCY